MLPDKHTYRPTITQTLRNEITTVAYGTFLEIGCDICYTTESLIPYFDRLIAIDILKEKTKIARERIKDEKVHIYTCTSDNLEKDYYDVILIDAAHDKKNVMNDFKNIYEKNLCSTYTVFFHDYGLNVKNEVKDAVHEICKNYNLTFDLCGEKENWNPKGSIKTNDYEAANIFITKFPQIKNLI